MNKQNLTGKKFNKLTAICEKGKQNGNYLWLFKCDCGNEIIAQGTHVKNGHTKSCGCLNIEKISKVSYKHGLSHKRIHTIWRSMMTRCYNPNSYGYKWYGAIGVKVCERWHDFINFFTDMGEPPNKIYTLDRYPNKEGDYELSNCRWATKNQQIRNTSQNINVEYKGTMMCLKDASELSGLSYHLVYDRVKLGWDIEKALSTPKLNYKFKNIEIRHSFGIIR